MTEHYGAHRAGFCTWLSLAALVMVFFIAAPALASVTSGGASWYSLPGNRTANGELMNPNALTAAHRTLAFGTRVEVKNLRNGRTVVVRINDRGPFVRGRVIDVSKAAARRLGIIGTGVARVALRVVSRPPAKAKSRSKYNRRKARTRVASKSLTHWWNDLTR